MRLIDADALEREGWSLCRTFQKDKDTMVYEVKKPSDFLTIESERKRGEWIKPKECLLSYPARYQFECSICRYKYIDFASEENNFCPNCGADMRKPE